MKKMEMSYLKNLKSSFEQKPVQQALKRVLMQNDLTKLFDKQEQRPLTQFRFSNEIKTMSVTSQKSSGRCWIFAGLNVLRQTIAQKNGIKEFELSQNYIAFWDLFEKINFFIESMDDFLECKSDDRTLHHLLDIGIQDGGQWDMFVSLIEKYGIVPKEAMVETASSGNTRYMDKIINIKLRQYAANARALVASGKANEVNELKKVVLDELFTFLSMNLGTPPEKINFEYMKKDEYKIIKDLTPQQFYLEQVGDVLGNYVSVINAPTKDKPYLNTYTVNYLGNVIGGRDIKYLNLEMKDLKELVLKQLLAEEVVWFGSDVGRHGTRSSGVWDDQSFDNEKLLGMSLEMSKEDQLDYRQSQMTHAMVITAVNIDEGKPNRWKIENSWGDKTGHKGYYLMSDTWFDQYVYQAVIDKKYLTDKQSKAWDKKPKALDPWDPMGSLAK